MTSNTETGEKIAGEYTETPGEILRKKRGEVGISIDEVSEKLNLQPNLIESLENNNYEIFNVETYLKGYLRAYAKFIGVDGDKVISLYNQQYAEKIIEITPDVKPRIQTSAPSNPVKLFSYVIGLFIVLALLVWYQKGEFGKTSSGNIEITTMNINKNNINGVDTSYTIIVHDNHWQWPISAPVENYSNEAYAKPKKALDKNVKNDDQNSLTAENDESPAYNIQESTDTMVLSLTGDCWTEIEDKDGNKVFYDLALEGKSYVINGKSPLTVFLGAAHEVSVQFNGSEIDIKPYIKFGLARFTLPE